MRPVRAGTILTLLGLGLAACGGHETPKAAEPLAAGPARDVKTAEVVRTGGAGEVAVPAAVQARKRAALSARMPASVTELPYQEGQWVKAGAVVVRLDDGAVRASVAAAEAGGQGGRGRPRAHEDAPREGGCHPARARADDGGGERRAGAAHRGEGQPLLHGAARPLRRARGLAPREPRRRGATPACPSSRSRARAASRCGPPSSPRSPRPCGPGRRSEAVVDGQPAPLVATVIAVAPSGDATTHRFELKADLPGAPGLRAGLFARLLVPGLAADPRITVPAVRALRAGRPHRPLRGARGQGPPALGGRGRPRGRHGRGPRRRRAGRARRPLPGGPGRRVAGPRDEVDQ